MVPWHDGEIAAHEFLRRTRTNAFLVLHDGVLVHEWYRTEADQNRLMPSWSVAKSIVALLVGQAIERDELGEHDRLVDVMPELRRASQYDEITVQHLLDMSSGVRLAENYNPWLPLRGTAGMLLSTNLDRIIRSEGTLAFLPGSRSEYRSIDTQLLGAVLSRVTGQSLSSLLSDRIWEPVGCESVARWNTDRPGGMEKAFCGINATARDFAKIGQLVLDDGEVEGVSVVPVEWITRVRTPSPHSIDGWGYSAQWWLPSNAEHQDLAAIGVYGQYVYVARSTRTVIVKLSDHGAEQDELETINALRAIASAL
jgi:CubicO group peptidase (beta-lactamase class C family)